ncbi:Zinc finger, RING/FYVE/PHD-type [Phytophthora cactorum]|nr:Zinc finger, RING/FYVE/PHD-type [Phytophthora cactorum]
MALGTARDAALDVAGEISDLQDALQAKKEELQEALDSRADHRQAETCWKRPTQYYAQVIGQSHSDLTQCLKEQERAFDQERVQVLEQASDAAETQRDITRRNLLEREKVLICPITLELFDFPVVTGCSAKTFSSEGLRQAIKQNPLCPFCRGKLSSTHPNRDVAKLVELHRRERFVLGIEDPETPTSSAPASQTNEHSTPSTAPTGRAHSSRRNTGGTRHTGTRTSK